MPREQSRRRVEFDDLVEADVQHRVDEPAVGGVQLDELARVVGVRELGVLKAIGMGPGMVFALVLTESLLQTIVAVAVALAVAIPGIAWLSKDGIHFNSNLTMSGIAHPPVWHFVFAPSTFAGPVVMLLFVVALAVLYPGLKAARLRPVEAIRHQ